MFQCVVQLLSCIWLFVTAWTVGCQASLSITGSRSLLKLMSIESVMPSNHLILCCPLLLLPSILPSIRAFSNEPSLRIRWPKWWNFSFNISPSNEHPGLISFRMDWLDLLAVQGTLKGLLQHHSSKASILWFQNSVSLFFKVKKLLNSRYTKAEKSKGCLTKIISLSKFRIRTMTSTFSEMSHFDVRDWLPDDDGAIICCHTFSKAHKIFLDIQGNTWLPWFVSTHLPYATSTGSL